MLRGAATGSAWTWTTSTFSIRSLQCCSLPNRTPAPGGPQTLWTAIWARRGATPWPGARQNPWPQSRPASRSAVTAPGRTARGADEPFQRFRGGLRSPTKKHRPSWTNSQTARFRHEHEFVQQRCPHTKDATCRHRPGYGIWPLHPAPRRMVADDRPFSQRSRRRHGSFRYEPGWCGGRDRSRWHRKCVGRSLGPRSARSRGARMAPRRRAAARFTTRRSISAGCSSSCQRCGNAGSDSHCDDGARPCPLRMGARRSPWRRFETRLPRGRDAVLEC